MRKSQEKISPIIFIPLFVFFLFIQPVSNLENSIIYTEPTPSSDDVNEIAHQLYCPVCENIPLDECNTDACRQWRDLIFQFLLDGKTEEEIIKYFSITYGNRVLPVPPAVGFNWLIYVVPPLALIFGLLLLFRSLRVRKNPGDGETTFIGSVLKETDEVEESYLERFKDEINQ